MCTPAIPSVMSTAATPTVMFTSCHPNRETRWPSSSKDCRYFGKTLLFLRFWPTHIRNKFSRERGRNLSAALPTGRSARSSRPKSAIKDLIAFVPTAAWWHAAFAPMEGQATQFFSVNGKRKISRRTLQSAAMHRGSTDTGHLPRPVYSPYLAEPFKGSLIPRQ
jgi:hypothetical protein